MVACEWLSDPAPSLQLDLATTHLRIAIVRRALRAALGTVVALLVGCGPLGPAGLTGAPAHSAKLWPTTSTPDGRFTIDYPPGWRVGLLGPDEQLVIGSYLLPAEPATSWWFDRARAALPGDGALVLIFDYGDLLSDARYRRLFPPRPAQLQLSDSAYGEYEVFGPGYLLKFADHGRAVQMMVALGDNATAATRMDVLRAINSLRVRRLN
jgi:hypothetical protein